MNNHFSISNFLFGFLILASLVGCVNVFKLSDIRSSEMLEIKEESKAKSLLVEMGIAHGIDKWKNIKTYTVNFTEEFYGFVGQQNNPFKNEITSLSLSYINNSNNGQIEILSGRETGTIWGVQDNQAYTIYDDVLKKTVDQDVKYWVPAYQFFIEFPKRIQEATAISYVGKDTINDVICEGVLASWKTIKPQKDVNQYLIWIDLETKRIIKIDYTKRAVNNFVIESAYFNNYNDYGGIILPSEFLVESNLVKKGLLHKMSIFGFTKNYMFKENLLPIIYEDVEEN